jgi:hypothetical protein
LVRLPFANYNKYFSLLWFAHSFRRYSTHRSHPSQRNQVDAASTPEMLVNEYRS